MKTGWAWTSGLAAAMACGVLGYTAGRARAAGIPAMQPMTYRGVLTDAAGTVLTGTKNVQLQLWTQATGGTTPCSYGPTPVTLAAGAFDLALPDACTTAVHANPDLWIEVFVDGNTLGRTKLGAVPFAVEADTASNAAGALSTRLGAIEGRLARDVAGNAQRICTGSTPIGSTNWQVYSANGVMVSVDTSACNFTTRPTYVSSLVGENRHASTVGGSSPYATDATGKTKFDVYVFQNANVTPAEANTDKWHIEWVAFGN